MWGLSCKMKRLSLSHGECGEYTVQFQTLDLTIIQESH